MPSLGSRSQPGVLDAIEALVPADVYFPALEDDFEEDLRFFKFRYDGGQFTPVRSESWVPA